MCHKIPLLKHRESFIPVYLSEFQYVFRQVAQICASGLNMCSQENCWAMHCFLTACSKPLVTSKFQWQCSQRQVSAHSNDKTFLWKPSITSPLRLCKFAHIAGRFCWSCWAYGKGVRGTSQTKHRHQSNQRRKKMSGWDSSRQQKKLERDFQRGTIVSTLKSKGNFVLSYVFHCTAVTSYEPSEGIKLYRPLREGAVETLKSALTKNAYLG